MRERRFTDCNNFSTLVGVGTAGEAVHVGGKGCVGTCCALRSGLL